MAGIGARILGQTRPGTFCFCSVNNRAWRASALDDWRRGLRPWSWFLGVCRLFGRICQRGKCSDWSGIVSVSALAKQDSPPF